LNSRLFSACRVASALLLGLVSGGFSGPACRSGVPLEQPPHQDFLPGCRESRKTSLPRHRRNADFRLLIADCRLLIELIKELQISNQHSQVSISFGIRIAPYVDAA